MVEEKKKKKKQANKSFNSFQFFRSLKLKGLLVVTQRLVVKDVQLK